MSEPTLYDPRWYTAEETPNLLDPEGNMTFGHEEHGHAGILTVSGIVDLMHYVRDEIQEWEKRGAAEDDVPEFLRNALPHNLPRPVDVRADLNPSAAFHTETFQIPAASNPIPISLRLDRSRVVVTNVGPNPVFLSFTDDADGINTAGLSAWCQLGPSAVPLSELPSVSNAGPAVTAPAAGGIITSISNAALLAVAPSGTLWSVKWTVSLAGTPGAGENNNFELTSPLGTVKDQSVQPGAAGEWSFGPVEILVTSNGLNVQAIAIGTAGAIYDAEIEATPLPSLFPSGAQPVPNQREFRCGGRMYAYSPLGGTIDIQEEYGYRFRES